MADGGPGLAAAAKNGFGKSKLQFTAIAPVDAAVDAFTVPAGLHLAAGHPLGRPALHDAPDFDLDNQTAAAQARQFGYNNDYTDILEIPGSKGRRAVLFANHEYTNETIMFPATMRRRRGPRRRRRRARTLRRGAGTQNKNKPWSYVRGARLNRRFLNDTAYELTGPVAGSALVQTAADPVRPQHPGHAGELLRRHHPVGHRPLRRGELQRLLRRARHLRRATSATDSPTSPPRGSGNSMTRASTPATPDTQNEANRFGWIVEVDPFDPTSTPQKHSAHGPLQA